eukprot:2477440-Amphidinium_carterae.1
MFPVTREGCHEFVTGEAAGQTMLENTAYVEDHPAIAKAAASRCHSTDLLPFFVAAMVHAYVTLEHLYLSIFRPAPIILDVPCILGIVWRMDLVPIAICDNSSSVSPQKA